MAALRGRRSSRVIGSTVARPSSDGLGIHNENEQWVAFASGFSQLWDLPKAVASGKCWVQLRVGVDEVAPS